MPSTRTTANKDADTSRSSRRRGFPLEVPTREFFWGVELTKEKPEATWTVQEEDDDDADYLYHTLFLRHGVLGYNAELDERHIVQVETENYQGEKIKRAILSLGNGSDMCNLDLNFGSEIPVVFRLIQGSGPVEITGLQSVYAPQDNLDETVSDEESEAEALEEEDETAANEKVKKESQVSSPKAAPKRKAAQTLYSVKGKKSKVEDEDEDECDDDDNDNDVNSEQGNDDENDEEMSDEDEEMESSPEKNKKGKATKKPAEVKAKLPSKKEIKKGPEASAKVEKATPPAKAAKKGKAKC